MEKTDIIIVTGAAGFIGSNLVKQLNSLGYANLILVDHLEHNPDKKTNLDILKYTQYIDKDEFLNGLIEERDFAAKMIIHLGARTDTTETDRDFLIKNNTEYSKTLCNYCTKKKIRFIYASSAATYGDGSQGFDDRMRDLKPLNFYAESKQLFDEWIRDAAEKPPQWVGLKFFNVYGPGESHKGQMASVIFHGFNQIKKTGEMKLFKSYKPEFADGQQKRDFIYVVDICKMIIYLMSHPEVNGIYNAGTGKARSFLDLAHALFAALEKKSKITFIDMPDSIKDKYQYFTEADMFHVHKIGYREPFYELEDGVADYITNYLQKKTA